MGYLYLYHVLLPCSVLTVLVLAVVSVLPLLCQCQFLRRFLVHRRCEERPHVGLKSDPDSVLGYGLGHERTTLLCNAERLVTVGFLGRMRSKLVDIRLILSTPLLHFGLFNNSHIV